MHISTTMTIFGHHHLTLHAESILIVNLPLGNDLVHSPLGPSNNADCL